MIDIVPDRKRDLLISSVNRTRRCKDEVLDSRGPAAFENIEEAGYVRFRVGMGVDE